MFADPVVEDGVDPVVVPEDPAVGLATAEGVKTPPTGIFARQAAATVEASEADLGASGLMVAFPAKLKDGREKIDEGRGESGESSRECGSDEERV